VYKEINSNSPFESGFKCEIFSKNGKSYENFEKIWSSFKDNYHVDENNLFDSHFTFHKDHEMSRIHDFYETHSDFKDNIINQFEIIDKSLKKGKTLADNKFPYKNIKDSHATDRGINLNTTLETSCLNFRRFCSIGTQTDVTIEQEPRKNKFPTANSTSTLANLEIITTTCDKKSFIKKKMKKQHKIQTHLKEGKSPKKQPMKPPVISCDFSDCSPILHPKKYYTQDCKNSKSEQQIFEFSLKPTLPQTNTHKHITNSNTFYIHSEAFTYENNNKYTPQTAMTFTIKSQRKIPLHCEECSKTMCFDLF